MTDDDLTQHLVELKVGQAAIHARLDNIERAVRGDGQPGLAQRVESLEASRNKLYGMGIVMSTLGAIGEWLFHRH